MDSITWKKIIIILLVYRLISILLAVIGGVNEAFNTISGYISFVAFFIFLFFLGKLIKNDYIKKNYFYCIGLIMGLLIIFIVLEAILSTFNLGTVNSQFIGSVNFILFSIISITIFKIAGEVLKINEIYSCLLYVLSIVIFLLAIILAAIFFFFV